MFERIEAIGPVLGCAKRAGNTFAVYMRRDGQQIMGAGWPRGNMDFMAWPWFKYAVIRQADGRLRIERMEG